MKTGLIGALGVAAGLTLLPAAAAPAAATPAAAAGEEPEEVLFLFPSYLTWDAQAKTWRGEIHAGVYEREHRGAARAAFRTALGAVAKPTPDEERILDTRVEPFMYDSEGGKKVIIELGGRSFRSHRSHASGHVLADVTLAEGTAGAVVPFRARLDHEGSRDVEGTLRLVGPEGILVISDIDDTVKDSMVLDLHELVANTFYRPYRVVDGMADLYNAWGGQAAIFFVTASPWQLFPPLWSFLADNGFPAIAMEMRQVRLSTASVVDLVRGPRNYKMSRIREILRRFPGRSVVLVGDSGERDPEVYATIAREFPARVQGIFIRAVRPDHLARSRYREVFADVGETKWIIFDDVAALPRDLAGWLRSLQTGD